MKKNITKTVFSITLFLFLGTGNLWSQDIHFSQFDQTPLQLNPAFAGAINGDFRVVTNYRSQWKSIPASYSTIMGSYDMAILQDKFYNGFIGVGLNVFSDRTGDANLKTSQANLSLSSNFALDDRQYLALGLQVGYANKAIEPSNLSWGNQFGIGGYNSSLSSGESFTSGRYSYVDVGAGVTWFYNSSDRAKTVGQDNFKINVGLSVFHLNRPQNSFSASSNARLDQKIVATTNIKYELAGAPVSIIPGILYTRQGSLQEFLIGTNLKYQINDNTKYTGLVSESAVFIGTWVRASDAFILTTGFLYSGVQIGLSYDFNLSALKAASNGRGGVEMAISYKGTIQTGKVKQNKVKFL